MRRAPLLDRAPSAWGTLLLCCAMWLQGLWGEGPMASPRPSRAGDGFERGAAAPKSPGFRKVGRLRDDPGGGEKVPRLRLEASMGVAGAESVPTQPGLAVGLAALVRPVGELWLGCGFEHRALTGGGRYQSLLDWSAFGQARYYFMLHREANRFVMAHLLLQVGYAHLLASGGGTTSESQGLDLGVGVGVGAALSTKVYLGLQFKVRFPVWLKSCLTVGAGGAGERACTGDPADFAVSTWQLSVLVTRSF